MKRFFFACLTVLCLMCNALSAQKKDGHIFIQTDNKDAKDWKLVWQDDFDGSSIDSSKWTKIGRGAADWNRHMSYDEKCYSVKDGMLYLRGIKNPDKGNDTSSYLTGGIWSKGKFAFQYGKIEIRAKLECGQGAWPAMWMLAEQEKYGKYPRNGEIDIMEHLNFDNIIYQTTHSYYTLDLKQTDNPPHHGTASFDKSEFNTFGINWYPDKLVFTLNGKETFTYPRVNNVDPSQWPYDQPFYLLLDMQLGGNWVGAINSDHLPVQMIIDWVKVYQ